MIQTPEEAVKAMFQADEDKGVKRGRTETEIAIAAIRTRDAEIAAWLAAEAKKYNERATSHEEDEAIDGYDAYDAVSALFRRTARRLRGEPEPE